jgi:hypothetical protein
MTLFKEITVTCFDHHPKDINTVSAEKVSSFNVKYGGTCKSSRMLKGWHPYVPRPAEYNVERKIILN